MKRLIAWFGCLMLVGSPVLAQEQISREIPLQHVNAVEVAALFADKPLPKPPVADFEGFVKRCCAAALADFPANAWNWQSYLETQSELRIPVEQPAVGAGKLLPEGMAEPPVAVTERNALRVKGTTEALAKLGEIVALLDRPVPQVALQVECLDFTCEDLDTLPEVSWSTAAGVEGLRWASRDIGKLVTERRASAGCLATNLCLRNGRMAQLRVAEVLPNWVILKQNEPPTRRTHSRSLRLDLQPRINADGSVTIAVEGELAVSSYATDSGAQTDTPETVAVKGQFRAAKDETLLLRIVTPWGKEPDCWPEHEQFGAQRLQQPVIAITPRVLGAEVPRVTDFGPLTGDTNTNVLNAMFGKAVREGADGIMLGMDDQGRAVISFRTGPEQWEPACILPSYALKPFLRSFADPAGTGNTYKRMDPSGFVLNITVEHTTIQGRPGLVLTWPKQ